MIIFQMEHSSHSPRRSCNLHLDLQEQSNMYSKDQILVVVGEELIVLRSTRDQELLFVFSDEGEDH